MDKYLVASYARACEDELLSHHARRMGMPRAEMCRRSIDLYTAFASQPPFWRVVQKLNGRRSVDIIVALLHLWVEGEIVLEGDLE
jgi:hypothetical protein